VVLNTVRFTNTWKASEGEINDWGNPYLIKVAA